MLDSLIVIVPLLAGLALIGVCARGIFTNPNVPNSSAAVLGVAALLCVAPTVLNLTAKLPGGTEISLVKDQLKDQTQQIKSDVGEQGANVKRQIEALRKRVDNLEKAVGGAVAAADKQPPSVNADKVVVILYADGRKDLATQIELYLLQKGYSANAIYTDFTELADAKRLPAGTVAFVSSETDSTLRNDVEKVLRQQFPQVQNIVDASAPKLASTAIQIRLF